MPFPLFDRSAVKMEPLSNRQNKKQIESDHVSPDSEPRPLPMEAQESIAQLAERIKQSRNRKRPVMLTFGAHTIKNGLGPVLIQLMRDGWVTHLATNGAGIIHDWEFAYQGASCEDVQAMVTEGRFGNWHDTGFYINLAINIGAYRGCGYGESVGAMIHAEKIEIPAADQLMTEVQETLRERPEKAALAADLLDIVTRFDLKEPLEIAHPWKRFSAQCAAVEMGIPFTGHPMIGHDIIYTHPMNHGAMLGRSATRDFLTFAESVSRLQGGAYVSVGSAVMSPMVFEKSLSMAQNLAIQRGEHIDDHFIVVNDLAEATWDWSQGEPPEENPAYYLRYNKTFSRMGGSMRYVCADNRDFLLTLLHRLRS